MEQNETALGSIWMLMDVCLRNASFCEGLPVWVL